MFNAEEGFIYGPYKEKDTYKLAKLSKVAQLPDTVKARHILVQRSQTHPTPERVKELVDSIKGLIDNKADFAELAKKFSADKGSAEKGGDLGWFTEGRMVKEFNDACFSGIKGDVVTVDTQYGTHIIEIQDKGTEVKKIQVTILDRKVEPSSRTYNVYYTKASAFASSYTNSKQFDTGIKETKQNKRYANNLAKMSARVLGLENPRQLVKWAYNAETGDVSKVFQFDKKFVVATLIRVREEGFANINQVAQEIKIVLKKEKKAEKIINDLKGKASGSSIESIASNLNMDVKEASDLNFYSFQVPGIGFEPNVIASAATMKEGEISAPIKGTRGVFVISISSIVNSEEEVNPFMERNKIEDDLKNRAFADIMKALRDQADIVDNRFNFF